MAPEGAKEQPGRVFQGAGLPEGGNHGHHHTYQVPRYIIFRLIASTEEKD
jgi:hypothetical protein